MRSNAVKQRYRILLLDWALNKMEHYDGNTDFNNHIPYSCESLFWLKHSWVDIPNSVFVNCFRRARILPHDAPYQGDISSAHKINAEGANYNPQSNSKKSLATLNEVCEEPTPADKVEQVQERLSQLTVHVPGPLMRFNEVRAEVHEKAVIKRMERNCIAIAANSGEEKEHNNTNPKPLFTKLSQFSMRQLEYTAEALHEWTKQNAEEVRVHVKDQPIDTRLRKVTKLLHNERMVGVAKYYRNIQQMVRMTSSRALSII